MVLFNGLIRRFSSKTVKLNKLRHFILTNRMFAMETKAVQNIPIQMPRRGPKPGRDIGSWVLLVIPVSSFGLGVWQTFRKFEKDKINDALIEKAKRPIVDLPMNLEELKDMEFCRVRVKGRFDHSKELYMGPRPLISKDSLSHSMSLLSTTKAGYLVITPFILSDRNLTILVNRGWVPSKQKLPNTRSEGQISEEVEFIGLVRNNEIRKPLGAKNVAEKNHWVYRDLVKMAEIAGTAPVLVDADVSSSVPGGPVGGQTIVQFPNDHLSYLVTWFSLSGISAYLWYLRHLQKVPLVV